MVYKEDMNFKTICLFEPGSDVRAYYEFKCLMMPNYPWIISCVKENLRCIAPSRSIPEIDTQLNLGKLLLPSKPPAKLLG